MSYVNSGSVPIYKSIQKVALSFTLDGNPHDAVITAVDPNKSHVVLQGIDVVSGTFVGSLWSCVMKDATHVTFKGSITGGASIMVGNATVLETF